MPETNKELLLRELQKLIDQRPNDLNIWQDGPGKSGFTFNRGRDMRTGISFIFENGFIYFGNENIQLTRANTVAEEFDKVQNTLHNLLADYIDKQLSEHDRREEEKANDLLNKFNNLSELSPPDPVVIPTEKNLSIKGFFKSLFTK